MHTKAIIHEQGMRAATCWKMVFYLITNMIPEGANKKTMKINPIADDVHIKKRI